MTFTFCAYLLKISLSNTIMSIYNIHLYKIMREKRWTTMPWCLSGHSSPGNVVSSDVTDFSFTDVSE